MRKKRTKQIRLTSVLSLALTISVLFVQITAVAQTIYPLSATLDTTLLELPSIREDENIVIYQGYISSFNAGLKIPDWVAYELTSEEVQGGNERSGTFKQDKRIPLHQASNADYLKTGYDKGHLAPAADMKWSEEVMSESFYFTNICPQKPTLNRRYWLALEEMSRDTALKYGKVWVISGAIPSRDSLIFIGKNAICVPTHFYKALLSYDGERYFSVAFLMENSDDPQSPQDRALSVDDLEDLISVDLFKNLGCDAEKVEGSYSLEDWEDRESSGQTLGRDGLQTTGASRVDEDER